MTREESIERLNHIKIHGADIPNESIDMQRRDIEALDMAIKALEEEPRWIPVSERLPEDSGEYLVSVTDKEDEDYKQVGVAWFAHPKDYDIQDGEWRELMIDEIVVAWMPLPKSYKAESEGKE